jgi:hypothetical protein
MPAWIRMPVPYRHQTPKSDHVTILPVVLTVQPFPCDRFYQVRCLQVFGKSISDCAEFMSLNLFEAKATVQGWVSLRKHLLNSISKLFGAALSIIAAAPPFHKTPSHPNFRTPGNSFSRFCGRFKLLTQTGSPAAATALHEAAREHVWSKTKEILARLQ